MKWKSLKHYPRDRRGAAAIELALGTVVMVAASLLALDLYLLAGMQTTTTHVAVSLADTVSRKEPAPPAPGGLTETQLRRKMSDFVQSLSDLLHEEQFPTANASFVVAAVYKNPGPPASLTALWSKEVVVLSDAASPLTSCAAANQTNEIKIHANPITLPAGFTMADREIVIVAEVCVERTNTAFPGPAYAHYIVPSRDDSLASRLSAP